MNASLIALAGLMLAAVAAPAQNASKIQYRTPVTEATPLGFTLNLQSRPDGGGRCYAPSGPSVVIVSSYGGTSYRGTYYRQPVSYRSFNRGGLNVSGYSHNYDYGYGYGYGRQRTSGWSGRGYNYPAVVGRHCGTVVVSTSCVRTVAVAPCVY